MKKFSCTQVADGWQFEDKEKAQAITEEIINIIKPDSKDLKRAQDLLLKKGNLTVLAANQIDAISEPQKAIRRAKAFVLIYKNEKDEYDLRELQFRLRDILYRSGFTKEQAAIIVK